MEVGTAIQIALTTLTIGAAISAASWARTVAREVQQLRAEVLGAIGGLRNEVAVRRVIRSLDEVPPELMSENARERIAEVIEATGTSATRAVQAAIEIGIVYSDINRGRNEEIGVDEDETTSGEEEDDDDDPPSGEPEPK
jgi:hypothetical protein